MSDFAPYFLVGERSGDLPVHAHDWPGAVAAAQYVAAANNEMVRVVVTAESRVSCEVRPDGTVEMVTRP